MVKEVDLTMLKRVRVLSGVFFMIILTAVSARADVVINECMINPAGVSDTMGEWLELYNWGDMAVDIRGWRIKDLGTNTHLIEYPEPLLIMPKSFFLMGREANSSNNGGYIADYVYSGFVLANGEDEIILENDQGVEQSRVEYNSSWPIISGRSLAYIGEGIHSNPTQWFATAEDQNFQYGAGDYGTPGTANMIPEPFGLLLFSFGSFLSFFISKKNGDSN